MIPGYGPVMQALLGTLFTWGLTAAGAACVIFVRGNQRKSLDAALGFAAGVMVAASFWSLLNPAIEMAESSHLYGVYAFMPVSGGFLLGAIFVYGCDRLMSYLGLNSTNMMISMTQTNKDKADIAIDDMRNSQGVLDRTAAKSMDSFSDCLSTQHGNIETRRRKKNSATEVEAQRTYMTESQRNLENAVAQWKRIMLLVVAITVHNIPEGLAVGVSFGAIGSTESSTFEAARNLAIGIGIQNFPEGLAVSLPLHAAGFSVGRALWYGQLSGMVEPIFGILGAVAVTFANLILPYALSFAAGAMIYIVADDILPEAHASGNGTIATWGTVAGFLIMMCLEVTLS
ncbi:PREDICTED: zinc transporter ZIP11 [Rhagoletis zephyria]|uniref:zinc transporter ZIP11 n=1 Tax=Rhagoletis zephyria TaxID=28612 RepID=UPI0008116704|nr:PREDICTED: zinc transporter ZIP11 [Rhagoletis zephyria]XP_036330749.1 zinc transporter ZIP11 [Rhagoletis pomonella]XP_036345302.1 zinc transporter ZIP11-like [Rhagoletis pomonella]XP_036345304.1 zinc transporter ZIP11-like [Rhagoletis pomonella]